MSPTPTRRLTLVPSGLACRSLTLTPNLTLTLTLTQVESVERLHAAATQKATAAAEALAQQVAVQARTLLDVTKVTRHQHLKQITEGAGIGL